VVELLFSYVDKLRTHFESVAERHGLTAVQAKVLMFLEQATPMNRIAESMCCDPSNLTGVVDRLEERGLLAREEAPTDRRVKNLQVTGTGKKMRDSFAMALFSDVPGMKGLSPAQLAEMHRMLSRLCGDESKS
jgi:DNA-binding MarR family transcriptional regulator